MTVITITYGPVDGERGSAPAVRTTVPPILDRIVRSAVEMACNLRPLLAILGH